MCFFLMDVENKITGENSIYARIWVHRNIAESPKWPAESSFLHKNQILRMKAKDDRASLSEYGTLQVIGAPL